MKEHLTFTNEDNAMPKLLLSVMGAFAEFERSLTLLLVIVEDKDTVALEVSV